MDTRTETTKRQAFAVLWHSASHDNFAGWFDSHEVLGWLELTAFPLLFGEGHCFRCHGFEDGPCHTDDGGMHECPGCMKEEQEHQLAVLQAKMGRNEATWKILKDNEPLTKKQAEDILNGKPIEEMKRLKDSE